MPEGAIDITILGFIQHFIIGGNFNNMGNIELKGISGNILVSNVLHNKGNLRSKNGVVYARKIINQGNIEVEDAVETKEFVVPPEIDFSTLFSRAISTATWVFYSDGTISSPDGEVEDTINIDGLTFSYVAKHHKGYWKVTGRGSVIGNLYIEGTLKVESDDIAITGTLVVTEDLLIEKGNIVRIDGIVFPSVVVGGKLSLKKKSYFSGSIRAGSLLICKGANADLLGSVEVAGNVNNHGKITITGGSQEAEFIVAQLSERGTLPPNSKLIGLTYSEGVSGTPSLMYAITTTGNINITRILSNPSSITTVSRASISMTVIGLDPMLSGVLEIRDHTLPPEVKAYFISQMLKRDGWLKPVLKRMVRIPGLLSPVGEFYDIGVTPEVKIGYYGLDTIIPRKIKESRIYEMVQKYKEKLYSLPDSYVVKRELIMAFEWKELTGELPAYAYDLLNEVSFSPSFRSKSSFGPMGIKIPSCRTYKITRKIIPKTNWDLTKSEYYKSAADVVYSAYDQYWNDHYGDNYWVGCGPVAAALVFRYWGFVNSNYGRCLHGDDYELLEKIHEKANTSADGETTVFDLAEGIEKTAKYYGMKFIAEVAVGSASFFEDEVDRHRMAIMLVQDDPEWGNHFVAVYGYEVEHRWETCCHTDSICPDHHYVRVI